MDDGGKDLVARKAAPRHVLTHSGPNGRKNLGERDDMFVFGAFTHLAEARVVAILLPASGIPPGGLNVSVGKWADPDVSPCRRDGERLHPPEDVRLCQLGALGAGLGESFAGFFPAYARPIV